MIKTLRITGIMIAVLAVAFFVLPVVSGVSSDEEIEEFLNSAGAVEEFSSTKRQKSTAGESQISPLVKQAERFALYLNPPAKPRPRRPATSRPKPRVTPRPTKVSAKFNLVGTSFYASHPELSLALIDEPGKGLRWVRQSSELGHLIIEQIKDGVVVVKDGQRVFEIAVPERPNAKGLLKKRTPEKTIPDGKGAVHSSPAPDEAKVRVAAGTVPQLSPEENQANIEELLGGLKDIQAEMMRTGPANYSSSEESKSLEEMISNLQAELKAVRISAEEAKKLDRLGKHLNDLRHDPNRADSQNVESQKASEEPNSPRKR